MKQEAKDINAFDKSGMLACVEAAPKQIKDAAGRPIDVVLKKDFSSVIISGMGGSA
ncbi:hypothetical protein HZB08_00380, partial [Candidatus Saganbacteria bacterium]|nr:hypothetical protein [Candidatus Saganbacteria bacterium]